MGVLILPTEIDRLTLRPHVPADAEILQRLLADNAAHPMSSGDYTDELTATVRQWREQFALDEERPGPAYAFGMWSDGAEMVGRIVLVPVAPPSYGLGYWVTNPQQGKGFATAAVRAILRYAATIGASDVFAGVNHGNVASGRVLEKCGFVEVADLDTYTRFHRTADASG